MFRIFNSDHKNKPFRETQLVRKATGHYPPKAPLQVHLENLNQKLTKLIVSLKTSSSCSINISNSISTGKNIDTDMSIFATSNKNKNGNISVIHAHNNNNDNNNKKIRVFVNL